MQLASLLAVFALMAPTIDAAECTTSQLSSFDNAANDAAFAKACESVLAASSVTSVDLNSIATLNPCGDADCLAYFRKLQTKVPNCEVSGVNLPATFNLLFSVCDVLPSGSVTPTGPTTPTTRTTKPTTTLPKTTSTPTEVPIDVPTSNDSETTTKSPVTTRPTVAPLFGTAKPPVSTAVTVSTASLVSVLALATAFAAV